MSADEDRGRPSAAFTGQATVNHLAETLSELARTFQDKQDYQETLQAIVTAAVGTVPGADHAAATVVQARRKVTTLAGTDDLVHKVDRAQYDSGQGPCLEATFARATVRVPDMSLEQRWPAFTGSALGLGIRSMLSFQLYVVRDDMGALNLYSGQANAFSDESEYIGLLLASHAAVAMIGAQKIDNMQLAVSVRDMIGQAKGILMERHRLSADQAFGLLVHASQHTNIKLTELARRLTETGELPPAG